MVAQANDDFGNAQVITGTSGSAAFDVTDATPETGEPTPANGTTVWYFWTAPNSDPIQFSTAGSSGDPDTYLAVYTGTSVGSLALVASDDDSGNDPAVGSALYGGSTVNFTPTASVTYRVQVDAFDDGAAGVLTWGPYTPPPLPAPTAGTWAQATGRAYHVVWPGDNIIINGTDLDSVTTVTIGGFVQATFGASGSTHLVVMVGSNARSGPIVVSNASGSSTASGDAATIFAGPWIQPADTTAAEYSSLGTTYSQTINTTTQPDFGGSPLAASFSYTFTGFQVSGFAPPPDSNWSWNVASALVPLFGLLDDRASTVMPPIDVSAILTATPSAVDYELEALAGTPVSDTVEVTFAVEDRRGEYIEDTSPRTFAEDLWQINIEFRRLDPTDWYDDGIAFLTGNVLPATTEILARTVDSVQPLVSPGATLDYFTNGEIPSAGLPPRPGADLNPGPDTGYLDPVAVSWDDYAAGVAWIAIFDPLTTGSPIPPPYMHPDEDASGNGLQNKLASGEPHARATFPYRPPRYRLLYPEPPVLTIPPLRQFHRDDGLAGGARSQVNPTSRQSSQRQGINGTYL